MYDYFFKEWLKVKDEYAIKKGIRSFSAYVTYTLSQLMREGNKDQEENVVKKQEKNRTEKK